MCIYSILPTNFQKNQRESGIHPPPPPVLAVPKKRGPEMVKGEPSFNTCLCLQTLPMETQG